MSGAETAWRRVVQCRNGSAEMSLPRNNRGGTFRGEFYGGEFAGHLLNTVELVEFIMYRKLKQKITFSVKKCTFLA